MTRRFPASPGAGGGEHMSSWSPHHVLGASLMVLGSSLVKVPPLNTCQTYRFISSGLLKSSWKMRSAAGSRGRRWLRRGDLRCCGRRRSRCRWLGRRGGGRGRGDDRHLRHVQDATGQRVRRVGRQRRRVVRDLQLVQGDPVRLSDRLPCVGRFDRVVTGVRVAGVGEAGDGRRPDDEDAGRARRRRQPRAMRPPRGRSADVKRSDLLQTPPIHHATSTSSRAGDCSQPGDVTEPWPTTENAVYQGFRGHDGTRTRDLHRVMVAL